MKNRRSTPPPPRPRPPATGQKHLLALVIALAVWVVIFALVLLEHARSWARLLPALFVIIVVYGAFVTAKLIKENKQSRE
jgi:hypothetical protein